MIHRAARLLELDVATQVFEPLAEARQAEIDALQSVLKRGVVGAVFKFSQTFPEQANQLLDTLCTPLGYRYLGAGVDFSAYMDLRAREVVKIHRQSATVDKSTREMIAVGLERGHKRLRHGLGAITLDQEVSIAPHIFGGYETVQIRQPLIEFTSADAPFVVNEDAVDRDKLGAILERVPGAADGLADFAGRSRLLYGTDRLVPDTNGRNNVVVQSDGSVVLLDTCPIENNLPTVQCLVLSQLASLHEELAILGNK